jgi:hypothetical protein
LEKKPEVEAPACTGIKKGWRGVNRIQKSRWQGADARLAQEILGSQSADGMTLREIFDPKG